MEFAERARKFSRVLFHIEATVKFGLQQFVGKIENLSIRGMFLSSDGKLAIGDEVEIAIALNDQPENKLLIDGKVVRVTEHGLALSFDRIDSDSYSHLKRIIEFNTDDADRVDEEIENLFADQ
jgi:Tfp pilus assembly protein PilZ